MSLTIKNPVQLDVALSSLDIGKFEEACAVGFLRIVLVVQRVWALEWANYPTTGKMEVLSEQQLLGCHHEMGLLFFGRFINHEMSKLSKSQQPQGTITIQD